MQNRDRVTTMDCGLTTRENTKTAVSLNSYIYLVETAQYMAEGTYCFTLHICNYKWVYKRKLLQYKREIATWSLTSFCYYASRNA